LIAILQSNYKHVGPDFLMMY